MNFDFSALYDQIFYAAITKDNLGVKRAIDVLMKRGFTAQESHTILSEISLAIASAEQTDEAQSDE